MLAVLVPSSALPGFHPVCAGGAGEGEPQGLGQVMRAPAPTPELLEPWPLGHTEQGPAGEAAGAENREVRSGGLRGPVLGATCLGVSRPDGVLQPGLRDRLGEAGGQPGSPDRMPAAGQNHSLERQFRPSAALPTLTPVSTEGGALLQGPLMPLPSVSPRGLCGERFPRSSYKGAGVSGWIQNGCLSRVRGGPGVGRPGPSGGRLLGGARGSSWEVGRCWAQGCQPASETSGQRVLEGGRGTQQKMHWPPGAGGVGGSMWTCCLLPGLDCISQHRAWNSGGVMKAKFPEGAGGRGWVGRVRGLANRG